MKHYLAVLLIILLAGTLTTACQSDNPTSPAENSGLKTTSTAVSPTATTALPPTATATIPPTPSPTPTSTATIPPTMTATESVAEVTDPVSTITTSEGPPYRIVNVPEGELLSVHSGVGEEHLVMGTIPWDGVDIYLQVEPVTHGVEEWVMIRYGTLIGWVKTFYLERQ